MSKSEYFSPITFCVQLTSDEPRKFLLEKIHSDGKHARTFHCAPWGGRRVTDTCACDVISLGQQRLMVMMKDLGYNHADLCKSTQS